MQIALLVLLWFVLLLWHRWLGIPKSYCYHPLGWPPLFGTYTFSCGVMVSINTMELGLVKNKTIGWAPLKNGIWKCLWKPWERWWHYPSVDFRNENVFQRCCWKRRKWWICFMEKRALCVSVRHTNLTVRPHYPGMGRGLARSLSVLVRDTSQLSMGCRPWNPGCLCRRQ